MLQPHFATGIALLLSSSLWTVAGGRPALGQELDAIEAATAAGIELFERQIRPLLVQHCYSCHAERNDAREGDLVLDNRQGWLSGGYSGPAIVPGSPDESLLIQAVRYQDPHLQMPPVKPLEPELVARLERWIALGAPAPQTVPDVAQDDPSDPVAGREHWAFRPLAESSPPALTTTDDDLPSGAAAGPIDAYIQQRLRAVDLSPPQEAPRPVLARRLYWLLTGLPPTAEQLFDFVHDRDPQAYTRLVDRLLASPQYGERWGRHWLDLARYADSNGLDENFLFREAWRYRNWVIAAVGNDIPFDRFLQLQLAGDLLPYDDLQQRDWQRLAAGFMVIGPKVLLGNDPNNQRLEVADEQLDTIGRVVLGQTLGCARCHNHKFDPIPTADYYALAGILTSTQVMQQRYMLGEQRVMEQLIGLGSDGQTLNEAYELYWRQRPQLVKQKNQAESALERLRESDEAGLEKIVAEHAASVDPLAADVERCNEERLEAQLRLVESLAERLAAQPAIPPRGMIPKDVEAPGDEAIRIAGQFDQKGDVVPRGFLQVLHDQPRSPLPSEQSGRLELAQWLTDPEQPSGQLAARVLANRIWKHTFGRGLVRTVDNFGRTGEPPTHPELLDYLAQSLIDHDWSIQASLRQLVLSRTFRASSQHSPDGHRIDPENHLLWRAHRRRIDPESLRDAMLAAAGRLDLTPMDSSVWYLGDQATAVGSNPFRRRTDFPCRSVYLPVIRNDLPEIFEAFDFTDPHAATGQRPETMVPSQSLFLLNDEQVMDLARATADRILERLPAEVDPSLAIGVAYRSILGSEPTDIELAMMVDSWSLLGTDDVAERLAIICHALFASSRFQFIE